MLEEYASIFPADQGVQIFELKNNSISNSETTVEIKK